MHPSSKSVRLATSFAVFIAIFLVLLSGCEATGVSQTYRATFTLRQGHEYCRIIPLPRPTPPPGARWRRSPMGAVIAHLAPEYPQSVVLTPTGGQAEDREGRYHSTTSIVVDFANKSVFSIPRDHERWRDWKRLDEVPTPPVPGSHLRSISAHDIMLHPTSIDYSKDAVSTFAKLKSFGIRGEFEFASFAPQQSIVQVWSEGPSFGVRRPRTGITFIDIFRVRDGRRLVQAEYDRYSVDRNEANLSAGVIPSDSQYFLPLFPWAETGLVCNFPPEMLK